MSQTILTLTVDDTTDSATLVARRGDLAHVSQFTFGTPGNLLHEMEQSLQALTALEANPPPTIPDPESAAPKRTGPSSPVKPPKPIKGKPAVADELDDQPTFSVTVAGKPKRIPLAVVTVPNTSIYDDPRFGAAIAKLIEGKLWDTTIPIQITDCSAFLKQLGGLQVKEMQLFDLTDFVHLA